jgi:transposase
MINRCRRSQALAKFLVEQFARTLLSDFWGAYNPVLCLPRQTCLVHLLRESDHTEKYKSPCKQWPEFVKKLRRLVGDAIRLWRRRDET